MPVSQVPTLTAYWCWRWEGSQRRWDLRFVSLALTAPQLLVRQGWSLPGWGLLLQAEQDTVSVCGLRIGGGSGAGAGPGLLLTQQTKKLTEGLWQPASWSLQEF